MKKLLVLLLSAVLLLSGVCAAQVSAASLAEGTYEVEVKLMHASKEQDSLGNQYIAQSAYLVVEKGSRRIYILPSASHVKDFDKVSFYYYTSGALSGSAKEAETMKNVRLGGRTVAAAASFLLPTDGDYVPMQFKASMMPITPSARLKVNYASAKLLEAKAAQKTTARVEKTTTKPAAAKETTAAKATIAQPSVTEPFTNAVSEEATTSAPLEEPTTGTAKKTASTSSALKWWLIGAGVVIAVCGLIIICFKKK